MMTLKYVSRWRDSCQYSDMARGGIQYVEHVDAVDEMNEAVN
jgi:hypothetical protein